MGDIDMDMNFTLEMWKLKFDEGGSIVYVWKAVKYCIEESVEFPDWILCYLLKSAKSLLEIDTPKKDSARQVMEAFGVKSGKIFSDYHRLQRREKIHDDVRYEREKRSWGDKSHNIFNDVASKHIVSSGTVKKDFEVQQAENIENHEVFLEIAREEERKD